LPIPKLFTHLGHVFDRRSRLFWFLFGTGSTGFLGFLDYATGPDIAWSFFFLFPVLITAWFAGRTHGIALSALSAAVWWIADVTSGHLYPHPLVGVWNATTRLGFFLVATWLAAALRNALDREREMARVDFTTGVLNSRAFAGLLDREVERCRRHQRPFSVAYLDLDDFKAVNDAFGHQAGDDLLRVAAETMSRELRGNDVVARLGGDEFAVLLPETDSEGACRTMSRIRDVLLAKLHAQGRPVTVSIGVFTCERDPCDVDEVVRRADALMYHVKRRGKHGIDCATWGGALGPGDVASKEPHNAPANLGLARGGGPPECQS
jgi:diguanylate cyclase (GGDEF)-like protein